MNATTLTEADVRAWLIAQAHNVRKATIQPDAVVTVWVHVFASAPEIVEFTVGSKGSWYKEPTFDQAIVKLLAGEDPSTKAATLRKRAAELLVEADALAPAQPAATATPVYEEEED